MSKIGIVTLYKDNFGSILQAYATYSYVSSLGNDCCILQNQYKKNILRKIAKIPKFLYKSFRYKDYRSDRRMSKITYQKELNLLSSETRNLMNEFVNNNFKISTVIDTNLKQLNREFDYFIVGSDQVWNGYDKFRYLVFADKKKRIAFAPSFGTDSVKDYLKKEIKKGLKGFDVLSSREETGVKIIKDLTSRDAIRLADPTILLGKEEWRLFALKGEKRQDYILIHFLNEPSRLAIETINKFIRQYGNYEIYCICNQYKIYDLLSGCKFIDVTPYDYVSLIDGAKYVFTDSFHTTLFSLNLETPFLTFERQYLHFNSQNSRIVDLLERVRESKRFIQNNKCNIDFNTSITWNSDFIFVEERNNLRKYLITALT